MQKIILLFALCGELNNTSCCMGSIYRGYETVLRKMLGVGRGWREGKEECIE